MEVDEAQQAKPPWFWQPTKRRRSMEDPFFADGNESYDHLKILLPPDEQETQNTDGKDSFVCQISNCRKTFSSVADYEMHHSIVHRNSCSMCRRQLPNKHLLDLHVAETHDSVFELKKLKENMYQCFVEICSEKFATPDERKKHAVSEHYYPTNFRFDIGKKGKAKEVQNKEQNKDKMETEPEASRVSESGRRFVYNVPKNICFGQGSQRGFRRGPPRGKSRKPKGLIDFGKKQIEHKVESMDL